MENKQANSKSAKHQLGILAMTLLVVSAMFGGGIFNIPQNMSQSAALGAIIIAWAVTALGVFFLAKTFQILSSVKPEMKSGIYMYSRAGFGRMVGFLIAWGYWMSTAFGNVGYAVLLMDALNYFFPPFFKGGNTWQAVALASVCIWGMSIMVMRGMKAATILNNIGTVAKFIPVIVFIIITLYFAFKYHHFSTDFWGNVKNNSLNDTPLGNIFKQIKSTMLVTLWMYIGIEGAVVLSDKSDNKTVGKATILGFFITTILYVAVSILPFGFFSQGELAVMSPPSTATILANLVGHWGELMINAGVIIALLSSWLVWTILVAELPWACAKDGTFPKVFAKTNSAGVASFSLWTSTVVMQLAMMLVYFSNNAWNVMLSITGVVLLPAYIGSSAYLWRLIITGQYPKNTRYSARQSLFISIVSTIYCFWLIYAAGLSYILLGCVIYTIGLIVFYNARKDESPNEPAFTRNEFIVGTVMTVVAIVSLLMLFNGKLPAIYAS
ncbi:arginine:agmatine antiporter [Enterobacter hormaechei subsp. hoffmannii]|uniref:basic amino acid/polyamine antiporter n=1 Tax=Enterobacter hormaechei TaxID=158836 RepID=UPI000627C765|nr:basic amino acid/polyamine antiporter [Enterobacter hormaechei]KKJ19094.1 arginine:agmatine antiporter [Enterobacter hormaechei subsp. hoffmannii]